MATQQNAVNDVSSLIKVPNKVLNILVEKLNLCIGSAIHDAMLEGLDSTQINVGIGLLCIDLKDMQVKLIPSKDLKTAVKRGISDKIDPLELELEQALIAKLTNICNEEV